MLQLGDQLIKNESIGLLELIKNSYDADATSVFVELKNLENPSSGSIIIEDDGIGMDMDIIKNVWMEPGTDYKENLYNEYKRSEKFNRLPLGEKGIGRFSVHKLGNQIELITKKEGSSKEIVLEIDWNVFSKSKYFEDTPIKAYYRKPEFFIGNSSGTRIVIKNLKTKWNRGMVREVYRSINSLASPFNAPDSFKVHFDVDDDKLISGLLSWEDIKDYSLFSFECEIEGDTIDEFIYRFTPWPSMKKLSTTETTHDDSNMKKMLKMVDKDNNSIDLSNYNIGRVAFKGLIFDRDPKILSLGVQDKKGLKDYISQNGGIRVYRDGIRVYDYGEPGNDWLNLDIRRVNVPTKSVSNNIIISSIYLSRKDSSDLIEKTNREGFLENEAYDEFVKAILYTLGKIETLRKIDKDKLRLFYGPTPASEPVISDLNDLKKLIDKKIKQEPLKKELNKYISRIEDDYTRINEILLKSAGLGLSLSVVIHELDKIIEELSLVIKKDGASDRIMSLVVHLSKIVEGYSFIIKRNSSKKEDLKNLIKHALFNVEFRLSSHDVDIINDCLKFEGNTIFKCSRSLILGTIINIIDNSIWWTQYKGSPDKKIYITISDELPQYTTILIADNGPGFSLPTSEITKPFVSGKPDGMGLGLHIAQEIMNGHGGQLIFPDPDEFLIPDEFQNGALTALAFKKEVAK